MDIALEVMLKEAIERHNVPGAVVALRSDKAVRLASAGVLSLRTGVPVAEESMFQIGSITKVFTATLIMQLVDQGKLDLDTPIEHFMPEFRLANLNDSARITCRHLLTHTSGIDGDFFADTGRGEDVLTRYIERCSSLSTIHDPGEAFSYCNTGYVIAGWLVEVLTGRTWDQVLHEGILAPLRMRQSASLPEDLVGRSVAIGHLPHPQDASRQETLKTAYQIPFSIAPAGATLTMSATDLLRFADVFINHGLSPDGHRILSEQSIAQMSDRAISVPGFVSLAKENWGAGWSINQWDGHQVIGHDGNTIGQRAFLRILPSKDTAMALLTNGGAGIDLAHELLNCVFAEAAGLSPLPDHPPAANPETDFSGYWGRYQHNPGFTDIFEEDGLLMMHTFEEADSDPDLFQLSSHGDALFSCPWPPNQSPWYVKFLDTDERGHAQCMFSLYRRCPRIPWRARIEKSN